MTAYARPGLSPQQRRQWRISVHRRHTGLSQWAAAVYAQLGSRVDELNIRELDLLSNALGRADRAFSRDPRGSPVSVRRMQRLIAPRLRLPVV